MSDAAAASTLPADTAGSHVRPSRCTITQGTTHCTCEPGYTISGRDSNVCTGVSLIVFFFFLFSLMVVNECSSFQILMSVSCSTMARPGDCVCTPVLTRLAATAAPVLRVIIWPVMAAAVKVLTSPQHCAASQRIFTVIMVHCTRKRSIESHPNFCSQILMNVAPDKTTAQRIKCVSTHMVLSSVSVWSAQKSLTLHMSKRRPCKDSFHFLTLRILSVSAPQFPGFIFYSHSRCERNPCPVDNRACSQAPNSISYHHLAVVSNLSAPRVMFRVSALRPIGDTLRFSLLGGKQARRHFTVQRSDRVTGELMLVNPVQGPATLEAEVEMTELERRAQLGRYITKVTMFVSQYDF